MEVTPQALDRLLGIFPLEDDQVAHRVGRTHLFEEVVFIVLDEAVIPALVEPGRPFLVAPIAEDKVDEVRDR